MNEEVVGADSNFFGRWLFSQITSKGICVYWPHMMPLNTINATVIGERAAHSWSCTLYSRSKLLAHPPLLDAWLPLHDRRCLLTDCAKQESGSSDHTRLGIHSVRLCSIHEFWRSMAHCHASLIGPNAKDYLGPLRCFFMVRGNFENILWSHVNCWSGTTW